MFVSDNGYWRWRCAALAVVLILEALAASIAFDTKNLLGKPGPLTHLVERWAPYMLRFSMAFAATVALWLYLREGSALRQIGARYRAGSAFRPSLLAVHTVLFVAAFLLSNLAFQQQAAPIDPDSLILLVILLGLCSLAALALIWIPAAMWTDLWKVARRTAGLAALCGVLTSLLTVGAQHLWGPATKLTFFLVKTLLGFLVSGIVSIPASAEIGTAKFSVTISSQCSGLEGAGLFLAFGAVGLLLFRKDFSFPNAFLLLPLGVTILFLLNAVRIALLILIGHAGAAGIAEGGFHSQAGWIFFIGVTLGLFMVARGMRFFTKMESGAPEETAASNAAPYLMPFLVILCAGMFTRAASSGFEWLYPARLLACAATLWLFRDRYRAMQWRCGGVSAAVGIAIFALWVGLDWVSPAPESGMPKELAGVAAVPRSIWILLRIAAACTTVPIAEELAFRAFLIRRFLSPAIEDLPSTSYSWLGLSASALLFGLLHGDRWIVGTIAGLSYSWVFVRKGRLGDPVAAHAITNGLLAGYVLLTDSWRFW